MTGKNEEKGEDKDRYAASHSGVREYRDTGKSGKSNRLARSVYQRWVIHRFLGYG